MSPPDKAIGGYFELELPQGAAERYPSALKYQSARAAFMDLLQQMSRIKRVWAPYYLCDSMLAPIRAAGKELAFYSINRHFAINGEIALKRDDLLLYVNYFGICADNVENVLNSHNRDQVVVDCSQAFYSGPYECLATIYSPRKFFGVPDGGLLLTRQVLELPIEQDRTSILRVDHLLKRLAFSAEAGYESYRSAEASLLDVTPKRMSELTRRLLASIDYNSIEQERKRNFNYLREALDSRNVLSIAESRDAPMCYPYLPKKTIDKKMLADKRIYVPAYWPEVNAKGIDGGFEVVAANDLLALPCDQRYTCGDYSRMLSLFERL